MVVLLVIDGEIWLKKARTEQDWSMLYNMGVLEFNETHQCIAMINSFLLANKASTNRHVFLTKLPLIGM